MTTEQLIKLISETTKKGDWAGVQQYLGQLKRLMTEQGRPLSSAAAYQLVEAMSEGSSQATGADANNAYQLVNRICEEAKRSPVDMAALRASWEGLYDMLANPVVPVESATVHEVLGALKSARAFELLARTADRVLVRDPNDPVVRLSYAQALIDSGQPHAAIEMLIGLLKIEGLDRHASGEANGMLGRAFRQLYVDHVRTPATPPSVKVRFRHYLEKSLTYYGKAFDPARAGETHWPGINIAAISSLAERDGLGSLPNPSGLTGKEVAQQIVAALLPKVDSGAADQWEIASLGEAYIALGDFEKAAKYYGAYISTGPDSFKLGSSVRQLEQVWRVEGTGRSGAAPILAMLKAAQVSNPDGKFTLPGDKLREIGRFVGSAENTGYIESMVPGGEFVKLAALQTVVARAAAVAAVCDATGRTLGTGFLMKGSEINETLGDAIFMLTNAHVLTDKEKPGSEPKTLDPGSARIVLEGAGGVPLKCAEVVWQSPIAQHDACLVRVEGSIGGVQPLRVASADLKLEIEDKTKKRDGTGVSVIGYPLGGPLSLSIVGSLQGANGRLVDIGGRREKDTDPVYMHYRAPTEPGNSGSPVFETTNWTVVGLHHMGFDQFDGRDCLCGRPGRNYANEGIDIRSIKRAVAAEISPSKAPAKKKGWLR